MNTTITIRQGDVALVLINALPSGCQIVPGQEKKIVLAWGEATGHHHRIEDHIVSRPGAADEIADAVIARAKTKARLWQSPTGKRYLEVTEPVYLKHEEHSTHQLPPGIYQIPVQVEYTPAEMRRVID
jgi:hypothetical protein